MGNLLFSGLEDISTTGLTELERLNDNKTKSIIYNLFTAYPTMRKIINKNPSYKLSKCSSQTLD